MSRVNVKPVFVMLLVLSLLVSACATGQANAPSTPSPVITESARVTIGESETAQFIPSYFAGFSIEPQYLCQFLRLEQLDPSIDQLYDNLSPSIIRIGGTSMDQSVWQAGASCSGVTFGLSTIEAVFAFARRAHAKVIWGLNLKANDSQAAADEANAVMRLGGSELLGIEMGNEPNNWMTESTYEHQWEAYSSAIGLETGSRSQYLVGPSMYDYEGHSWFAAVVQKERSLLALATYHYYPLAYDKTAAESHEDAIHSLLDPKLMAQTAADLDRVVAVAHANGLALEIDETNSVNGGGVAGLSDTFASTLWVADYLFTAEEHGVLAMNLHGSGGANTSPVYSPILIDPRDGAPMAQPMYYGMLFFHLATGSGRTRALTTTVTSSANLVAHAVLGANGTLQVALINKDVNVNTLAGVTLQQGDRTYHVAHAVRLLAPAITATTNITLGGTSVMPDGTWSSSVSEAVNLHNSSFSIVVPRASAVLITLVP